MAIVKVENDCERQGGSASVVDREDFNWESGVTWEAR